MRLSPQSPAKKNVGYLRLSPQSPAKGNIYDSNRGKFNMRFNAAKSAVSREV
jgi:hypothetical protein